MASDKGDCDALICRPDATLDLRSGGDIWCVINNVSDLAELNRFDDVGIVISGGEEEKIGVKNYDEIDRIFEAISN